jgi:hypothetical protein
MDACPVIVHIVVGNCVAGAVVLGVGKLVMHDSLVRRKPSVLVVVMVVVVHDGLVVIVVVVNDDMVRREVVIAVVVNDDMVRRERGVGEPCDAEVRLRRLGRVEDVVVLVSIEPAVGQNVEGAQDGVNTVIVIDYIVIGMLVLVEASSMPIVDHTMTVDGDVVVLSIVKGMHVHRKVVFHVATVIVLVPMRVKFLLVKVTIKLPHFCLHHRAVDPQAIAANWEAL